MFYLSCTVKYLYITSFLLHICCFKITIFILNTVCTFWTEKREKTFFFFFFKYEIGDFKPHRLLKTYRDKVRGNSAFLCMRKSFQFNPSSYYCFWKPLSWAGLGIRSNQMSDCERFPQILLFLFPGSRPPSQDFYFMYNIRQDAGNRSRVPATAARCATIELHTSLRAIHIPLSYTHP